MIPTGLPINYFPGIRGFLDDYCGRIRDLVVWIFRKAASSNEIGNKIANNIIIFLFTAPLDFLKSRVSELIVHLCVVKTSRLQLLQIKS